MYNLEVDKIIEKINNSGFKIVLLQFPDGLKPESKNVVNKIEKETNANCIIWFGSCFGACDMPDFTRLNVDLFVPFGHNQFVKEWDD